MLYQETITKRTSEWLEGIGRFHLPDWDSLPQLELYMDQVIILLKQYLAPLYHGEEDKAITASIINNYVRMKIMPPPVKKKYGRVHIACLVVICALKRSLSISGIQRLLPLDRDEEEIRRLYNSFVSLHHVMQKNFVEQTMRRNDPQFTDSPIGFLTSCAILANLSTGLTEHLLTETADSKSESKNSAE